MKIQMLIENTANGPELAAEHGLSLYIETKRHKILFDMGQSGQFADNARRLGVDLSQVDLAVLSHGHYDHGGGMARFFEENDHAPVYVQRDAFEPHWSDHDIGLDERLSQSGRIVFIDDGLSIDAELELLACSKCPKPYPMSAEGMFALRNGVREPDDFRHEQVLLIRESGKRVLISGCSHTGILNIISWLKPDVVIGGFHFMKLETAGDDAARMQDAAKRLLSSCAQCYTCHCTGLPQYAVMKEAMGARLSYLAGGDMIEL